MYQFHFELRVVERKEDFLLYEDVGTVILLGQLLCPGQVAPSYGKRESVRESAFAFRAF